MKILSVVVILISTLLIAVSNGRKIHYKESANGDSETHKVFSKSDNSWLDNYKGLVSRWMNADQREEVKNSRPRLLRRTGALLQRNHVKGSTAKPDRQFEAKSVANNDKRTSFVSSLLGSFLPVFKTKPMPSPATPRPRPAPVVHTRTPAYPSHWQSTPKFPVTDTFEANKINHERNAFEVSSGYAQVNKNAYPPQRSDLKFGAKVNEQDLDASRPNALAFCDEALKATTKFLSLPNDQERRLNFYEHLWKLVQVFHLPLARPPSTKVANRKIILVVNSLCRSGSILQEYDSEENLSSDTSRVDENIERVDNIMSRIGEATTTIANPFLSREAFDDELETRVITARPNNPIIDERIDYPEDEEEDKSEFVVSGSLSFSNTPASTTAANYNKVSISREDDESKFEMKPGIVEDASDTILDKRRGRPVQNLNRKSPIKSGNNNAFDYNLRTTSKQQQQLPPQRHPLSRPYFPPSKTMSNHGDNHQKYNKYRQRQQLRAKISDYHKESTIMQSHKSWENEAENSQPFEGENKQFFKPGRNHDKRLTLQQVVMEQDKADPLSQESLQTKSGNYIRDIRQTMVIPPLSSISTTRQPQLQLSNGVNFNFQYQVDEYVEPSNTNRELTAGNDDNLQGTRNITLNDVHYMYNVTFLSPPVSSKKRQKIIIDSVKEIDRRDYFPNKPDANSKDIRGRIYQQSFVPTTQKARRRESFIQDEERLTEFHSPPDADMKFGTKTPQVSAGINSKTDRNKELIEKVFGTDNLPFLNNNKDDIEYDNDVQYDENDPFEHSIAIPIREFKTTRPPETSTTAATVAFTTSRTPPSTTTSYFPIAVTLARSTTPSPSLKESLEDYYSEAENNATDDESVEYYYVYEEYEDYETPTEEVESIEENIISKESLYDSEPTSAVELDSLELDDYDRSSESSYEIETEKSDTNTEDKSRIFDYFPESESADKSLEQKSEEQEEEEESEYGNKSQDYHTEWGENSSNNHNYPDTKINSFANPVQSILQSQHEEEVPLPHRPEVSDIGEVVFAPPETNEANENGGRLPVTSEHELNYQPSESSEETISGQEEKHFDNAATAANVLRNDNGLSKGDRLYFRDFAGRTNRKGAKNDVLFLNEWNDDHEVHVVDNNDIAVNSAAAATGGYGPGLRNDRFAQDGLKLEDLMLKPASIQTKKSAKLDENLNPEQLAYILIGVCCGLSILCLIVVAVSIGYKSETHYRLEDGRKRKHIKLLKASSNDDTVTPGSITSVSSRTFDNDDGSDRNSVLDMAGMKLGPWFNGKHTMRSLERKPDMVFPTPVYLSNLEKDNGDKGQNGYKEMDNARSSTNASGSSSSDQISLSSLDSIGPKPSRNSAKDSVSSGPHQGNRVKVLPDSDSAVHGHNYKNGQRYQRSSYRKNSYSVSSSRFSQGTMNLNKIGKAHRNSIRLKMNRSVKSNKDISGNSGSFRFLAEDDTSDSTIGSSRGIMEGSGTIASSYGENSKECNEIQWSNNTDRLI